MLKYLLILLFASPIQAYQTKQEIIDYCTRVMLAEGGYILVEACIQQEIEARDRVIEFAKS